MLTQGRDYVQLKTKSAVLESDCLDFLFQGFQVQGCCLLNHLNWDTLQQRRLRTKAIMMYRIINGLVAIESPPCMHHLGVVTRGQQQKYIVPYSTTTVHKIAALRWTDSNLLMLLWA
jgi:hypothetical protein